MTTIAVITGAYAGLGGLVWAMLVAAGRADRASDRTLREGGTTTRGPRT